MVTLVNNVCMVIMFIVLPPLPVFLCFLWKAIRPQASANFWSYILRI